MSPSIPSSSVSEVCLVLRGKFPAAESSLLRSAVLSVWCRFWGKETPEEIDNVLAYVVTNAYYRVLDRLQQQAKVYLVPDPEDLPRLLATGPCSPEQELLDAELRQVLQQTQEQLRTTMQNDAQRAMFECLVRKHLGSEPRTYAEIATLVGYSERYVWQFWQDLRTEWGELLDEWRAA
jgi:hypothetical protein